MRTGILILPFIGLFTGMNIYWPVGDVDFFGFDISSYSFGVFWVSMIAIIWGANYATHSKVKNNVWLVICTWWTANITMTESLQAIEFRGIGEAGDLIWGYPSLILDFPCQSAIDLTALFVIAILIRFRKLEFSPWVSWFGLFLLANLWGHASGAYRLMNGVNPDLVGVYYESYLFTVFTIMLIVQAAGSGLDALLKGKGSNGVCGDIRVLFRSLVNRYLHLH